MAYIKDSVISCFKKQLCELEHNPDKFSRVKASFLKNYVIATLEANKTDDVEEVKHGEWIDTATFGENPLQCSCCENTVNVFGFAYCPNCGAKMDGGKAE